jgi:hypothetical protein
MARYLRDRIADAGIEVLLGYEVRELAGDTHLERVTIEDVSTGERRTIDAGALVVLIGALARTDWLVGAVALEEDGFVLTGHLKDLPSVVPDVATQLFVGTSLRCTGSTASSSVSSAFTAGFALWLGCNLFVVTYEEPTLRKTFGAEYGTFCANVPRWVPRLRPWSESTGRTASPASP